MHLGCWGDLTACTKFQDQSQRFVVLRGWIKGFCPRIYSSQNLYEIPILFALRSNHA